MKDDLETSCMNELFGSYKPMIAQVYVKSDDDNTAILVARDDTIYFNDLINNITVMTIKIDRISEKNLDVTIIGQDVKMKMERMEEN